MHRKLLIIAILCLIAFLIFPYRPGFADEKLNLKEFREEWTVERYTKYFYNRYSAHFDKHGLFYMVPDYGINYWKAPKTAREHMALAIYYKYRAKDGDLKALEILENALSMARREISSRPKNTQSFEDAEAIFLMVRVIDEVESRTPPPPAGAGGRSAGLLQWISEYAEYGLKVPDTENRAIISAAHWQYIIDYLGAKGIINAIDRKRYEKILKDKIDFAVKTNIKDYWYIEGRFNDFTPHYHAVAAYMLMVYSKLTADKKYEEISKKMYENLKLISFDNGMVEAELGHRPCGLGAQFYLMAGILGKSFEDPDYTAYLFYGFGDRFFSDPRFPNRLEYHPTIEDEVYNLQEYDFEYNDDCSFADKAEFALAIPSLGGCGVAESVKSERRDGASRLNDIVGQVPRLYNESKEETFKFTYQLSIPEVVPQKKFIQENTGREITFNGRKFILGSYGNYSRRVE
ncbi:hypothetical protein A2Y83_01135 [Candidatus Falkowbacteria bacterium RBG_13_39_14]|uniref:Alginate lyase domain-containing protein n=1 Tax=Candidatus Falkowbacteria bacterium RBG_13_39_14 TaxID=1797985 RepID=A0A1F5S251_9BACT|nr:MAG: hypothetical protein A2Y83_01135 [Candidatus Falkowbacteria bacterium RBG_13_39_14]